MKKNKLYTKNLKNPTSDNNNKYKAYKNKLALYDPVKECISLNLLKILNQMSKIHGMF